MSIETRDTIKRHKDHENCVVGKSHFIQSTSNNKLTIDKLFDLVRKKENLNELGNSIYIDPEGRIKLLRIALD